MSAESKESLQAIAAELGENWGDKPNISGLIEAIAQGKYLVSKNADWPIETIMALNHSWQLLEKSGEVAKAREVAELLLLRADLPPNLLEEIQKFLAESAPLWRQALDEYIACRRPFELNFLDPITEVVKKISCQYGEIIVINGKTILRCWCKEKSNCLFLPHNWKIQLNEIEEASVSPLKCRWKALDSVLVEVNFWRSAALSYTGKKEDLENDWSLSEPGIKKVVRPVLNVKKFFAELRSYGGDCKIVAPLDMADGFRQEIDRMMQRYEQPP